MLGQLNEEFNKAERDFIGEMQRAINGAYAEGYKAGFSNGYGLGQIEKHDYSPVISELDPTVKEELDRLVRNNEFRYGKEL